MIFLPLSLLEGVTRHVGEALGDEVHVRGSKIVALGIAPWGVVQQRDMLVGIDVSFCFHSSLLSIEPTGRLSWADFMRLLNTQAISLRSHFKPHGTGFAHCPLPLSLHRLLC